MDADSTGRSDMVWMVLCVVATVVTLFAGGSGR